MSNVKEIIDEQAKEIEKAIKQFTKDIRQAVSGFAIGVNAAAKGAENEEDFQAELLPVLLLFQRRLAAAQEKLLRRIFKILNL